MKTRLMRGRSIVLVALGLGLGLGACAQTKVCAPGSTQPCSCTDGAKGAQSCAADGDRWAACACSKRPPADCSAQAPALPSRGSPGAAPADSSSGESQLPTVLGIVIRANGDIFIDDKLVPNDEAVLPLAKEVYEKDKGVRAIIRADSSVPHGHVIRVLELIKQAGITKIAFGVAAAPPE